MIAGKTKREISNLAENDRISENAIRCRKKFLRFFPNGFADEKYVVWERGYKWRAHERWNAQLNRREYESLLEKGEYGEIAGRAVKIESPTNLIFLLKNWRCATPFVLQKARGFLPKVFTIFCTARANRSRNSSAGWKRSPLCRKSSRGF